MDKFYDILKALGQIVFPSALTFFGLCGHELNWAFTDVVVNIGAGFITMWNAVIVIWSAEWKKQQELQELE